MKIVKRFPESRDPAINSPWGKDEVVLVAWLLLMLLVTSLAGNVLLWSKLHETTMEKRACQRLLTDSWNHAVNE